MGSTENRERVRDCRTHIANQTPHVDFPSPVAKTNKSATPQSLSFATFAHAANHDGAATQTPTLAANCYDPNSKPLFVKSSIRVNPSVTARISFDAIHYCRDNTATPTPSPPSHTRFLFSCSQGFQRVKEQTLSAFLLFAFFWG
ncbi:hypothetical protein E2542_SST07145 [Spatholobus suberectus]|nr:hypothetical protein E2542_SST07145 [Spatholobus suberectus]